MREQALIIFARKPEAGKVKTRLAATIGAARALEIYIRLLEHTRAVARAAAADGHVFLTEDSPGDTFWNGFSLHLQEGADLGERMSHAFTGLFARGYKKVVIIGSDCPGLTPAHAAEAFAALDTAAVVIGPADDGGYYLLGCREARPELFRDKQWSTDTVLADTVAQIEAAGDACHCLERLRDVDEAADLPAGWL